MKTEREGKAWIKSRRHKLLVVMEHGHNTPASRAIHEAVVTYMQRYTQKGVEHAGNCILAFCDPEIPDFGLKAQECANWRAEFLRELGLRDSIPRFSISASCMVTEAFAVSREASKRGIEPHEIIVFCDPRQVRSLKIVLQVAYPSVPVGNILFYKVKCKFGGPDYKLPYMRSDLMWRWHNFSTLINLKRHGVKSP